MEKFKTIILGIDGATWDILKNQAEKGNLPTFEKLMKDGAWGPLESCIPPVTAPAWVSIATGKNPGKTGVFDFFNRVNENNLESKSVNSYKIKRTKPFWDILSENNFKIGIWNYPFLYPPYEINGFMVSGLAASPNDEICYPKNLKNELLLIEKHYEIDVSHGSKKYIDNEELFIKDISNLLTSNEKIIEYLIKNKDVNLFFGVISALDFMQHYLWKHIDKNHPSYKDDNPYKDEFLKLLKQIDNLLSKILEILPDNTNIFLVSDHGFGPHISNFYVNQFLLNSGYLKKISKTKYFLNILLKSFDILRHLHSIIKLKQIPWDIKHFNTIDIKKSLAFNLNSIGIGGITINPILIKNKNDFLKIREDIIKNLIKTTNSLKIKCEIFLPQEIYNGKYTNLAPDIMFKLDDFAVSVSQRFNKNIISSSPSNHSGEHRMNGIFLAYGPDIKKGINLNKAKLYDIAPTILHMFDISIPDDIDGRVLKEIFKEESEYMKKNPKYSNYYKKNENDKLKNVIRNLKIKKKI